jgi:hypothetical protein
MMNDRSDVEDETPILDIHVRLEKPHRLPSMEPLERVTKSRHSSLLLSKRSSWRNREVGHKRLVKIYSAQINTAHDERWLLILALRGSADQITNDVPKQGSTAPSQKAGCKKIAERRLLSH